MLLCEVLEGKEKLSIIGQKDEYMTREWFTREPIAHRGYHWEEGVDENSREAFELALEKRVPFECDLHLSKDGEVFIHHDYSLERMTGYKKNIGEVSSSELDNLKTYQSSYGVTPLKDLLKRVNGEVPIVLEIKRSLSSNKLEKRTLEILKGYRGEFSLQGFHPQSLFYCRKECKDINLGLLSGGESLSHLLLPTRVLLRSMSFISLLKPQYLAYEWSALHKRAPQEMRERYEIPLLAWTINDEKSLGISKLLADNIIYENLEL